MGAAFPDATSVPPFAMSLITSTSSSDNPFACKRLFRYTYVTVPYAATTFFPFRSAGFLIPEFFPATIPISASEFRFANNSTSKPLLFAIISGISPTNATSNCPDANASLIAVPPCANPIYCALYPAFSNSSSKYPNLYASPAFSTSCVPSVVGEPILIIFSSLFCVSLLLPVSALFACAAPPQPVSASTAASIIPGIQFFFFIIISSYSLFAFICIQGVILSKITLMILSITIPT